MSDLTPDEAKFFETGELPESLQIPAEPVATPSVASVSPPTPTSAPASNATEELLRQQLATEQLRNQQALDRLAAIERQLQEKLNPPISAPDPETDPLGNLMHQVKEVSSTVTNLQQNLTQDQQNKLLQQQFDQFTQSVRAVKEAFEKTTPDFNDAYNHIRNIRTEDLRSVGIPEVDIPKVLLQDELNIAQAALARGKNPAEEMYNMAKRYGYAAKTSLTPTQKVEALQKGQQAAKNPQRGAADTELTMESLVDAGDADLSKMVQNDELWAKLVGGTTNDIFGPH